jgi:hypothetical protein
MVRVENLLQPTFVFEFKHINQPLMGLYLCHVEIPMSSKKSYGNHKHKMIVKCVLYSLFILHALFYFLVLVH